MIFVTVRIMNVMNVVDWDGSIWKRVLIPLASISGTIEPGVCENLESTDSNLEAGVADEGHVKKSGHDLSPVRISATSLLYRSQERMFGDGVRNVVSLQMPNNPAAKFVVIYVVDLRRDGLLVVIRHKLLWPVRSSSYA